MVVILRTFNRTTLLTRTIDTPVKPIESKPKPTKPDKVIDDKFKFDDKLVKFSYNNDYNVEYYLYKSNDTSLKVYSDPSKEPNALKNDNRACFSGLPSQLNGNSKTYNRLQYHLKPANGVPKSSICDVSERKKWIELSIKYKFLPDYIIKNGDIKNNKYVIKLTGLSPSLLYTYLSTLRVLVENPNFVRSVLILMDKYEIPYYLSYLLASKIAHGNAGHHIIDVANNGGMHEASVNNLKGLRLIVPFALKEFIGNPSSYDKRSIFKGHRWDIQETLRTIESKYKDKDKVDIVINATDLLKPEYKELIKD